MDDLLETPIFVPWMFKLLDGHDVGDCTGGWLGSYSPIGKIQIINNFW